jgi:N-acetylmuramoyl-L-alanine amidase
MADIDILARTICGEARGEGDIGMQAVANVVLNRVAIGGWWGDTVTNVCQKPYQFSCWNQNDTNRAIIEALDESKSIFRDAFNIAAKVMSGELPDITNGATHYFAKGIALPEWAQDKTPCATIGHHIFYNSIA